MNTWDETDQILLTAAQLKARVDAEQAAFEEWLRGQLGGFQKEITKRLREVVETLKVRSAVPPVYVEGGAQLSLTVGKAAMTVRFDAPGLAVIVSSTVNPDSRLSYQRKAGFWALDQSPAVAFGVVDYVGGVVRRLVGGLQLK